MKVIFFFFFLCLLMSCTVQPKEAHSPAQVLSNPNTPVTLVETPTFTGPLVEITLTAKDFAFEPTEIHVHQGDHVVIHAKSIEGYHGLGIQEYDVNVDLPEGEEQTIEFNADKTGTFAFYCSVPCGSGHRAMKGKLVVE
ncbi:MAG: cupredoxin domain-containing protein [Nanoarchaeota archaeon]